MEAAQSEDIDRRSSQVKHSRRRHFWRATTRRRRAHRGRLAGELKLKEDCNIATLGPTSRTKGDVVGDIRFGPLGRESRGCRGRRALEPRDGATDRSSAAGREMHRAQQATRLWLPAPQRQMTARSRQPERKMKQTGARVAGCLQRGELLDWLPRAGDSAQHWDPENMQKEKRRGARQIDLSPGGTRWSGGAFRI